MKKTLVLCALMVVGGVASVHGTQPSWWVSGSNQILTPGSTAANDAPANVGQLKFVAKQAKGYLDQNLVGGSGTAVTALINGFTSGTGPEAIAANYAPLNIGQLKSVAKPFYDRLLEAGYDTKANLIAHGFPTGWAYDYPWNPSTPVSENYAPANLGQLKAVFSFDLSNFDTDSDGLPDSWEIAHFGNLSQGASGDPDGDGLTNLQEYQQSSDPNNFYSQGSTTITPILTVVSGNNQTGASGQFVTQPLVVSVSSGSGALTNVPVQFQISGSYGQISTIGSSTGTSTQTVLTGSDGTATVYLNLSGSFGVLNAVQATAGASSVSFAAVVDVSPSVPSGLALWLSADTGVTLSGTKVSAWLDQSGLSNSGTQGNAASQPIKVDNVFEGKPVVRFTGSNYLVISDAASLRPAQTFTVVALAKRNSSSTLQNLLARPYTTGTGWSSPYVSYSVDVMGSSSSNYLRSAVSTGAGTLHDMNVANQYDPDQPHFMSWSYSGSDQSVFCDGQMTASLAASGSISYSGTNVDVALGARSTTSITEFLNADVAEVLFYNRALSVTERQQAEMYLADKYGMYYPGAPWILTYSSEVQAEINKYHLSKAKANGYANMLAEHSVLPVPKDGLTLWLKADEGLALSGTKVLTWSDQSGLTNDGSQSTAANQPVKLDNALGGKPMVRFSGSQNLVIPDSMAMRPASAFTVIAVAKKNSSSTSQHLISRAYANSSWSPPYVSYCMDIMGTSSTNYLRCTVATLASANLYDMNVANQYGDSTAHVMEWGYDGSNQTVYCDGYTMASIATSGSIRYSGTTSITIGSRSSTSPGEYLNGDVAEVLFYDRALSTTERQQVESYLKTKYSLDPDTDGDGMPNSYEVANGLNPAVNDALLDKDGDGVPNYWEYLKGTAAGNKADFTPDYIVDPAHANDSPTDNIVGTISAAIGLVPVASGTTSDYKTILVKKGEYAENITLPAAKRIALVGERSSTPVKIIGSGSGASVNDFVVQIYGRNVVDGFIITRPTAAIAAGTVVARGVYLVPDGARITNCVITGHYTGIYAENGSGFTAGGTTIDHCTIYGNGAGGGLSWYNQTGNPIKIASSILWDPNSSTEIGRFFSSTPNITSSIVRGGGFTGAINSDPMLKANGMLSAGSPAIDADTGTDVVGGDIEGDVRPYGAHRDIGADEYVDSDGDGLPDSFELEYFGNLSQTATGDYDGDGLNNLGEYLAGTNPTLTDTDGDGATDAQEASAGSDSHISDTDGDGMPDGYEENNGLNPLADDSMFDKDGDGVPNYWEYVAGTAAADKNSFNTDWIVDPAHANDSSTDNIVATIAEAINAAPTVTGTDSADYKTILIKAGEYAEKIAIPANKRIALVGQKGFASVRVTGTSLTDFVLDIGGKASVDGLSITRTQSAIQNGTVTQIGIQTSGSNTVRRLSNCIVTGHAGAGISHNAGTLLVDHCTIFNNRVTSSYRTGITVEAGATALNLVGNILWTDGSPSPPEIWNGYNKVITASNNLIRGGAFSSIGSNPMLTNGGLLTPGSPAIDADLGSVGPGRDIQGDPRPYGNHGDIGADEYIDSDGDGLLDVWELEKFGDLSHSASEDTDGDGLTNLQEFEQGSDPANYYSQGSITIVGRLSINGGNGQTGSAGEFLPVALSVRVTGTDGNPLANAPVTYTIYGSNGGLATSSSGTVGLSSSVVTGTDGIAVVYLKLSGTTNAPNQVLASTTTTTQALSVLFSATVIDSDDDAMPDAWEIANFGSLSPGAGDDPDGDGLTNLQEFQQGSDPNDYFSQGNVLYHPFITLVGGNNQIGYSDGYFNQPLYIEVHSDSATGPLLPNAPVTYSVVSGSGGLAAAYGSGTTSTVLSVRTGTDGAAGVYLKGNTGSINVVSVESGTAVAVQFTARGAQADGLWSHWAMYEAMGQTIDDVTGLTATGTLINGPTWTTGFDGHSALNFNGYSSLGGSDAYVTMGNLANGTLDLGEGSFSIVLWAKFSDVTCPSGVSYERLISKGAKAWNSGYELAVDASGHVVAGLGSTSTGTSSAALLFSTTTSFNDGKWHHIAAVVDREGETAQIYVDGTAQGLQTMAGAGGTVDSGTPTVVDFTGMTSLNASRSDGILTLGSYAGTEEFFKGSLDDVRIYRKALSSTEVGNLYGVDDNGDGLPDHLVDSDGDGMDDAWEIKYGLDPHDPSDAELDSDGDGLSNLEEYRLGRNPTKGADTDPSNLNELILYKKD